MSSDIMAALLGKEEQRLLMTSWQSACQSEAWDDEARNVESDLFFALLPHLKASTQLKFFLGRPVEAFDDQRFGLCFKVLTDKQIRAVAQGLLASTPRDLVRKLFFLLYQPVAPLVQVLGVEQLVGLLDHVDVEVQQLAELWIFACDLEEVWNMVIERGKITPSEVRAIFKSWEGVQGPKRSLLPYEKLARTLDLGSLSYIVCQRPNDIDSYARDLDLAVQKAASARSEDLKADFFKQTLEAILRRDGKMVENWARLAVVQSSARQAPLIESGNMMLEVVCEILLEANSALGVELFHALLSDRRNARTVDNPTGVDVLALTLFRVHGEKADALLLVWADSCNTDKDLFEVALAASAVRSESRLCELIQQRLGSPVPVEKASAIVLAGFSVHGSEPASVLDSIELHPEGWLHGVKDHALRQLNRDRWAQEWFRRFANCPSIEESFACFRLFLRCVDRRYWVWRGDVLRRTRLSSRRRSYLAVQHGRIVNAIKENEKEREKSFLGEGIADGKVYPWLKRYLG